jgi:hypothetical protein
MKASEPIGRCAALLIFMLPTDQEADHNRRQRARETVGGEHCKDHGHRQWRKEITGGALEEEDRDEDAANRQRRDQGRNCDSGRAFENRLVERLAFLQQAMRVLDRDGRIVDENADGERQAAKRHRIDGLAKRRENSDRSQNRERDRDHHDERRAPGAEEDQDHQGCKARRDRPFAQHARYRVLHKY